MPSPINPPSGCRFHTRCPFAAPVCRTVVPKWEPVSPGHNVACHRGASCRRRDGVDAGARHRARRPASTYEHRARIPEPSAVPAPQRGRSRTAAQRASRVLRLFRLALGRSHALVPVAAAAPGATGRYAARSKLRSPAPSRRKPYAGEAQYLERHPSFERPYGLRVANAAHRRSSADALARAARPARSSHACERIALAWERTLCRSFRHAQSNGVRSLLTIRRRGRARGRGARRRGAPPGARALPRRSAAPLVYEPSGEDFLSPALMEADLMQRLVPHASSSVGSSAYCRASR